MSKLSFFFSSNQTLVWKRSFKKSFGLKDQIVVGVQKKLYTRDLFIYELRKMVFFLICISNSRVKIVALLLALKHPIWSNALNYHHPVDTYCLCIVNAFPHMWDDGTMRQVLSIHCFFIYLTILKVLVEFENGIGTTNSRKI